MEALVEEKALLFGERTGSGVAPEGDQAVLRWEMSSSSSTRVLTDTRKP